MRSIIGQVVLIFICSVCIVNSLLAQAEADSLLKSNELVYSDNAGNLKYFRSGKQLKRKELFEIMNEDAEAAAYVGKYNNKKSITTPLGFLGGALIGFPLGQLIAGGEPLWVAAISGAGLLVVTIPISISANGDIKRGIDVYNANLGASAQRPRSTLQLGTVNGGIGISCRFY